MEDVKDSFNRLPETDHKDGKYRLRRYSVVEYNPNLAVFNCLTENDVKVLPHRDFLQSEDLNEHQGGFTRSFEDIEPSVLQSIGMKEIFWTFYNENNLKESQEIEIHQMRVVTQEDGTAQVAPEGVHQDGFDHIAMIGVNRHNISGGELMVYKNKDEKQFVSYALKSGEIIMLKDNVVWHNAKSISNINKNEIGWGDWFVLCANE